VLRVSRAPAPAYRHVAARARRLRVSWRWVQRPAVHRQEHRHPQPRDGSHAYAGGSPAAAPDPVDHVHPYSRRPRRATARSGSIAAGRRSRSRTNCRSPKPNACMACSPAARRRCRRCAQSPTTICSATACLESRNCQRVAPASAQPSTAALAPAAAASRWPTTNGDSKKR
jgi:hypothetical protein